MYRITKSVGNRRVFRSQNGKKNTAPDSDVELTALPKPLVGVGLRAEGREGKGREWRREGESGERGWERSRRGEGRGGKWKWTEGELRGGEEDWMGVPPPSVPRSVGAYLLAVAAVAGIS